MLNFSEELSLEKERIDSPEELLGETLMQPFANSVSGSRKILFETQLQHSLPLFNPEMPITQTGYENRYGEYSSCFIEAKDNYKVVAKISKYTEYPDHMYYLLVVNQRTNRLEMIDRVMFKHNTESYGYLFNNKVIDNLSVGGNIKSGTKLKTSLAYDENYNRSDGVNLMVGYINTDKTMEDGIQICNSARYKLASPLIKNVAIKKNENDIFLNLLGDDENYKSFPDIGEDVHDGILCALRTEKIEESLYTQSASMLRKIMMSDTKFTVEGKVVDINIYCNNPEQLTDNYSNRQLLRYYNDKMRFIREFVSEVDNAMSRYNCSGMSYDLKKLYTNCKKEINGVQFMDNGKFYSGTYIEFIICEYNLPMVGDKLTNRYGGKGVISQIIPDELMPRTETGLQLEMIYNGATCVNRLNHGQLREQSLNFISQRIIEYIKLNVLDTDEALDMILTFIRYCSPTQANSLYETIKKLSNDERRMFLDSIIADGNIVLSLKPISESVSIDTLDAIYKEFPWIKQYQMTVPMVDSNGNIRYVNSRRNLTCGKMYIYRLKQYAEEKFSVTSLSSTNLKNENTKSKANKQYKALHQNTPIRFGYQETEDMLHMAAEYVVQMFMIHSLSPKGRRLVESILTNPDPYEIDIKLDSESTNRNVEILNAYLKTIGLRLVFKKYKKRKDKPVLTRPVYYDYRSTINPLVEVDEGENFDPEKYSTLLLELQDAKTRKPIMTKPIYFEDPRGDAHSYE